MCSVNCVVCLTDQRPFFFNLLPVFLLYFCYTDAGGFLCSYSASEIQGKFLYFEEE